MIRAWLLLWFSAALAAGDPVALRIIAANLTSENQQSYSPDNANHSNPGGAGARILSALKPDIVLIQEFNTTVPVRQWINRTLGEEFFFMREEGMQIPNGVISRFPIIESGVWDDPVLDNREFAWARLRLPEKRDLWVVSVHFHSKGESSRARQAEALVAFVRDKVPADAMVVIGGDLNTRGTGEKSFPILGSVVVIPDKPPADENGDITTNSPRNRPYDWVLASKVLDSLEVPVKLGGKEFPHGLVFDSRVFGPLEKCPPVQKGDSAAPFMQHMAVVRDFLIP
jgi:endonuclease/exonuclease/phosphatase family metal-dependent hydrolase